MARTRRAGTRRAGTRRAGTRLRAGDRGQAALELLGVIPVLLLVALVGIQLGVVAYAASQANTAARTAARTASQDRDSGPTPEAAGTAAISDWLQDDIQSLTVSGGDDTVTATAVISIPSVIPGIGAFGPVTRTAVLPVE